MALSSIPAEADQPDARFRIFWIEDQNKIIPWVLGAARDQSIQIITAESPRDVWQLLYLPEKKELLRSGFDAYITDFRLTAVRAKSESRHATDVMQEVSPENVTLGEMSMSSEPLRVPSEEELGILAPSAGMLIGLLVSFHFTERPCVIVPYSAFPSEFGDVWKLVSAFAPTGTRILGRRDIDINVDKRETDQWEIISAACLAFRNELIAWVKGGKVTLRTDELSAFADLLPETRVPNDQLLTLIYETHTRRIKIGGLFADNMKITRGGVPLETVKKFIAELPVLDEEQKVSREIAKKYIKLAEEDQSVALYNRVFALLDNGLPIINSDLPSLGSTPWLGVAEEGHSAVHRRNAFLIILVYIHAKYVTPVLLLEEFAEGDNDELSIGRACEAITKKDNLEIFPEIKEGFNILIDEHDVSGQSVAFVLDELNRPGADKRIRLERIIQRYVNPRPQNADKIMSRIPAEAWIGKGLRRLLDAPLDGDRGSSRRLQGILEGRRVLDSSRLRVARTYAKEVLPPHGSIWPEWLQPIGVAE